jgi:uncharacterized 2Fe-2S/4Fe-4S cluster protein (DUF4445 family)
LLAGAAPRAGQEQSTSDLDREAVGWGFDPPVMKLAVTMAAPSADDNGSDVGRLLRELKLGHDLHNVSVDFGVLRTLSEVLRAGDWHVTATVVSTRFESTLGSRQSRGLRRPKLIRVEPGDTTGCHCILALDIGTTSVWGQLIHIPKRTVIATASDYNGQISFGEDVITRIVHAERAGGLEELQKAVVRTVNKVVADLLEQTGMDRGCISAVSAAGNTTMTHLLLGLPPRYIRAAPYVLTTSLFPPVKARSLGLDLEDSVSVYAFPAVASYVGGDIVAGVLGAGFYRHKDLTLYMDLGTNGEVVLGGSDWMVSASCSAGPALEGGGVRCGVRASPGAIDAFALDGDTREPRIRTMGEHKPIGICGVGLIEMIAELLGHGILEANGKFDAQRGGARVREGEDGVEYLLVAARDSATGDDIVLTERDIENIVRSKAAMYAGVMTLLDSVSLDIGDIQRIIVAGALGNYLDIEKCKQVGLFPDVPREVFSYIGNGSLLGARLVALSNELLDDAERIAKMITNIELSDHPGFYDNYLSAMFLPHTDMKQFPHVAVKLGRG